MRRYLKPKTKNNNTSNNDKLSKLNFNKLTNYKHDKKIEGGGTGTGALVDSASSSKYNEDAQQTDYVSEDAFINEYHKYMDSSSTSSTVQFLPKVKGHELHDDGDTSDRKISDLRGGEPQAKRVKVELLDLSSAKPRSQMKGAARTSGNQVLTRYFPSASSSSTISSNVATKIQTRDTSKLPREATTQSSLKMQTSQEAAQCESNKPSLSMTPELKAMLMWQKVRAENLDCDYIKLFSKREADELFQECEKTLTYLSGELARVKVYGKTYDIPRKQVAHGDKGVTYTYSGVTIPAKPWNPVLNRIKDKIQQVTQHTFNFVLINRYEDGNHYMGEHRDDEKDLRHAAPIASVSFGCTRDFVFRHTDSRGREAKRTIPPIKLQLEHGSVLVMKYPTNVYWYHALPVRKKAKLPRINLTFRDIVTKESK